MNQIRKAQGCWWVLLAITIIGALIFGLVVVLPFVNQKMVLDSMAGDGDVESYTRQIASTLRIALLPLLILAISLLIYLLARRTKSISKIQAFITWLQGCLRNRLREINQIFMALKTGKEGILPINHSYADCRAWHIFQVCLLMETHGA